MPADPRMAAARLSVVVGLLLLAVKWTAWVMTGSVAVLGDALESVVHVAATGFMWYCLRLSQAPPDANHPYGHGKAESLSIGFEGGMILLSALAVISQAAIALWHGARPEALGWGLALIGGAAAVNLVLGWHLLRVGRRTGSAILVADGHHVLSDVWTSGAVFIAIGLMAVAPEAWAGWIDALTAIIVALAVAWVASRLIRESVHGLMDEVDPAEVARTVAAIEAIREPTWLDVHNLRLRRSGEAVFVDLHLVVPSDWTVAQAHETMERIEQQVLRTLGRSGAVLVHLDHAGLERYAAMQSQPLTVASATRTELEHP